MRDIGRGRSIPGKKFTFLTIECGILAEGEAFPEKIYAFRNRVSCRLLKDRPGMNPETRFLLRECFAPTIFDPLEPTTVIDWIRVCHLL